MVLQDAGAYPMIGAFLPFLTRMMPPGVYDIPKVEFNGKSVVTTTPDRRVPRRRPARGHRRHRAGDGPLRRRDRHGSRPRCAAATSSRNDEFPFTTPYGLATYDSGDYERALDLLLEASGYDELRAEQAARRERGDVRQLGIGVSTYVEVTAPLRGGEYGAVEVTPDGGAIVRAARSRTAKATTRRSR